MLHPDLVFTTSGVFPGFDPVYRGPEGMSRFAETMLEAWATFELEPTSIEDHGEYVVVALRFRGIGRSSGVETTSSFHHALRFRGGLVERIASHPDRAQALEAFGLSE
jgi:ketosteroid isomerase-like protein